jgi:serine/threonine-protein kinase
MGAVYRAMQLTLHRTVAVKVIRPDRLFDDELRERFIREARVAAAIEHPNVVPIYDVGAVDGLLFIAMRFVSGPSLADVLATDGPLDVERARRILRQVAYALNAAHDLGLVHRDVKPSNILLTDHGGGEHVYLADFGLARFVAQTGLTRTGQALGTLPYMSPEQILGQGVDRRTDVYALGCVLYEVLVGSTPFEGDDAAAIIYGHLHRDPPEPSAARPDLERSFDPIVAAALAKDPESRYPSTIDLLDVVRDPDRESTTTAQEGTSGPSETWPDRITQTFIEARVPSMSAGELEQFIAVLRERNWSDADLQERVYPWIHARQDLGGAAPDKSAAITLYANTGVASRTRELLRILPGGRENALTPSELGEVMHPDEEGQPLSKASVRAVIRNLLRVERRLLLEEQISRRVLAVDWEGYDIDGAGRYYDDVLDRKELGSVGDEPAHPAPAAVESASAAPFDCERVVLIRISRLYSPTLSAHELYEATRKWWVLNPAHEPDYAFSVYGGFVRAVYRIESWEQESQRGRWAFHGVKDEEMQRRYVGVDVTEFFPRGAANPIRYLNC